MSTQQWSSAGTPPAGYWMAWDGCWYPPESLPRQYQVAMSRPCSLWLRWALTAAMVAGLLVGLAAAFGGSPFDSFQPGDVVGGVLFFTGVFGIVALPIAWSQLRRAQLVPAPPVARRRSRLSQVAAALAWGIGLTLLTAASLADDPAGDQIVVGVGLNWAGVALGAAGLAVWYWAVERRRGSRLWRVRGLRRTFWTTPVGARVPGFKRPPFRRA